MNHNEKEEFDKKHIWHPYTSMLQPLPCYQVNSAYGVYINLDTGERLIDGMSSWWCAIHGYNNKEINEAVVEQVLKVSHIMFGGITHDPAINLCKLLVDMTHKDLECVFLCDSGSVSVEVALKQAIQYWEAKGEPNRKKFLTIGHGYHGDTFGAMSVCDPVNSMHTLYKGYVPENIFADPPQIGYRDEWDESDVSSFESKIEENKDKLAAVIIEPVLQGAGGMRMYHPMYLKRVRELCDKHNILLVLDEVATGFGRTGKLFAYEHANIRPDIMCVGKAISGGYLTLAAVISTRQVSETISSGKSGCFMHGPTFMGNPLACAASVRNLEMLQTGKWREQVAAIENQLFKELLPLKGENNSRIKDVRVLGAIGVIELTKPVNMGGCQKMFVDLGVWVRPFGKLIYIMPPYIIKQDELSKLIGSLIKVAKEGPIKDDVY